MITLITAVPGGGKSALMCHLAQEWLDKGRKVYVHGLKDPNFPCTLIDVRLWHEPGIVEDGALVLVDEAQDVPWRPTGAGQRLDPSIAALETHRHRGLDFILTTQGPHLVHSNIRDLVGRHVHLRNLGILGRRQYEWPEIGNPKAFKGAPIQKGFKLPKRAFEMYKSASLHVASPLSVPPRLIVAALAVVVLAVGVWWVVDRVAKKNAPVVAAQQSLVGQAAQPGSVGPPGVLRGTVLGVAAKVVKREPFAGLGVHVAGSVAVAGAVKAWYSISSAGRVLFTLPESALLDAGYSVQRLAPCVVVLGFNGKERLSGCDSPSVAPSRPGGGLDGPSGAASGPSA